MARVSIYVPDNLKARMDEAGDAINWSEVARPAFLHALAVHQHRKGKSVQTAIERLKASKASYTQTEEEAGKLAGRNWAADQADYSDLLALSKVELASIEEAPGLLYYALKNEGERDRNEVAEICFNDVKWPPDGYVAGFIEGAQELFNEVEDQL